ncbi:MAG: hypothetical protein IJ031_08665 [Oscillospiraceae bacterium]|nr:hypothetical protein [Oscillospiraceae bacterium]MBQ8379118.1 hypothetical protein [Oscillospiraceae bacterium]MBQ8884639.1 hypothetical protein [Oscillospiraceae bacterium]
MVRKYFFYFIAQLLSVLSLIGYYLVGNFIFEMSPTGETFDVYNGIVELTPYVYVKPAIALFGVLIQALGIFLFSVCFGILAKYCKFNLNHNAKVVSFGIFACCYIAAATYLFTNNFVVLNIGDSFAMKEMWANALAFLMCFGACVWGFCAMYYFKNNNNHLIYSNEQKPVKN